MGTATKEAAGAAASIVRELELEAPVDVEAVAKARGIGLRRRDLEPGVSGMLVLRNGQYTIIVNANHHPNRQRFTIAHELGHAALHASADDRVFVDGSRVQYRDAMAAAGTQLNEVAANRFAAELLMPPGAVKDQVKRVVGTSFVDASDESAVERLARHFDVSAQSMAIRLTQLGLFNADD